MSVDAGLLAWLEEATAPLGHFSWRRMGGAAALYIDQVVFAIADDDQLLLKSDAESAAAFDAADCERYVRRMGNRDMVTNYRHAPSEIYDDADAVLHWAALALEAGRRAARRKRR